MPAPHLSKLKRRNKKSNPDAALSSKRGYRLIDRDRLFPDDVINEKAIVVERYSTSLIPKGWVGRLDDFGHILCEVKS